MTNRRNILIVDDDADDREIMKDAFAASSENGEYAFLENGDKLLEYLEQNVDDGLPALILLNMPGKDGRETLKEIKTDKRFSHIPIVVFTTSSAPRDRTASYELGANCFITKPDTFNKLIELAHSISKLWLA
jgi:two-component system response regulator